jgi:hypothetical protein
MEAARGDRWGSAVARFPSWRMAGEFPRRRCPVTDGSRRATTAVATTGAIHPKINHPTVKTTIAASFSAVLAMMAAPALAQQFEPLYRGPAPHTLSPIDRPQFNTGLVFDANLDGFVDIIVKTGAVLISDGDLGFVRYPVGSLMPYQWPNRFAADIDGDGRIDLLREEPQLFAGFTNILVQFGQPGGGWSAAVNVGVIPAVCMLIAIGDVDGDDAVDLVLSDFVAGSTIRLVRNQAGSFSGAAAPMPAVLIGDRSVLADFDADGDLDLVTERLVHLVNDGTGTFTASPPIALPTLPTAMQAADADGDGDLDLLLAFGLSQPMQLWLNVGGTFAATATVLPPALLDVCFADLDVDGVADVLVAEATASGRQYRSLRRTPSGAYVTVGTVPLDWLEDLGAPIPADLDNDGDLDVVSGGQLCFLNDGALGFTPLQRHPVPRSDPGHTVAVGDIDGDGFPDAVVGNLILRNRGDGSFFAIGSLPPTAAGRELVDLDLDGDLDLVWTRGEVSSGPGICGIMANQGGVLVPGPAMANSLLEGEVIVGDFDADGRPDLISRARRILRNLGGLTFAPVLTLNPSYDVVVADDLDQDGDADLVINFIGGAILRNAGGWAFSLESVDLVDFNGASAADIDGDGDRDLVVSQYSLLPPAGGSMRIFYRDPLGWSAGPVNVDGSRAASDLFVVDVDADGDLDVVGRSLWLNQGGVFSPRADLDYTMFSAAADLDRDGDVDIVRAGGFAISIQLPHQGVVYLNRHRHLGAPRLPVLGRGYTIELASQPGYGPPGDVVVPFLATSRLPAPLATPFGLLQIDPVTSVPGPLLLLSGGEVTWSMVLPTSPSLAGVEVLWQAVVLSGVSLQLTGCLPDRLVP